MSWSCFDRLPLFLPRWGFGPDIIPDLLENFCICILPPSPLPPPPASRLHTLPIIPLEPFYQFRLYFRREAHSIPTSLNSVQKSSFPQPWAIAQASGCLPRCSTPLCLGGQSHDPTFPLLSMNGLFTKRSGPLPSFVFICRFLDPYPLTPLLTCYNHTGGFAPQFRPARLV